MSKDTFLRKIARQVLADHRQNLLTTTIVLPNRRAKVFLVEELRKEAPHNLFSPEIISVEQFVQDIADLRAIDNIEVLFDFYTVYQSLIPTSQQQKFENFANWAKTLLQDFNEIDRYLLDPKMILSYLKDIEDIKKWGVEPEQKTPLLEKYIDFWKMLPQYYESLYAHLLKQRKGYQGMIYREALRNLEHFSNNNQRQFIFAGFNALNAAEERIFQHLLANDQAKVYWDVDGVFLKNKLHDAGLFTRRFKSEWSYYKTNSFEWIADDYSQPKTVNVIGTPKTIGQAKIAGSIIEKIIEDRGIENLDRVAIVLGEENLLIPLLYALPSDIEAMNITMGYSARNNPVQILISKIFKLHTHALSRQNESYVMYYKDVLDILTHPLFEPFAETKHIVRLIKENNFTFISHQRLFQLYDSDSALFNAAFTKWDDGALASISRVGELLLLLKEKLDRDNEEAKITKAFVYAVYKVVNKIHSYIDLNPDVVSIETLHSVYKQTIDLAEVSFEGEPLTGLQVMGVLESRVLDFDTVIVTSMNEGKFPAGKSSNSFIPYDVKVEYGLPTFKEKDAIYTYHFYHLLQRAQNIYLLYNTDSEGLDGGERSRFITQLEVERQDSHVLTHQIHNAIVPPDSGREPLVIEKSDAVMARLKEIASKGFSPSALTSYIRNPLTFYRQKILKIRETEEVEESIAANTLGTVIHAVLHDLHQPLIRQVLREADLLAMQGMIDVEVRKQFAEIYKEGNITKGRNLLAYEVAKRNIEKFIKMELQDIRDGAEIVILALEKTYAREINHPSFEFPITIAGNVDRIDRFNNRLRIIDYKTGRVEAGDVCLKQWGGLTEDPKNEKIIQLLTYAFVTASEFNFEETIAGIYSFKNMKTGFLPFEYHENKVKVKSIDAEIQSGFEAQLILLLSEIFDQNTPFTEKLT
ncbi:MAG: PD-(D/E)XK nuclease family protein [Flavobacterium sp.]|nr:PD-(D/E)XK nuclease family protein [Flavobacterium sp.]